MEAWTLIAGMTLVTISALSMARHWRHRPIASAKPLTELDGLAPSTNGKPAHAARDVRHEEQDFRRRQFRRRMQGSVMIGILGIMLPLGALIASDLGRVAFAAVMLSLVGWMILLALADLVATRHHFHRLREQLLSDTLAAARVPAPPDRPESSHPDPQ